MSPKEEAINLMLLHFDRIHKGHTLHTFVDILVEKSPQYFDCKVGALIAIESHIYSENDSPFPTMDSWREDNGYWNEVKKELEKI